MAIKASIHIKSLAEATKANFDLKGMANSLMVILKAMFLNEILF